MSFIKRLLGLATATQPHREASMTGAPVSQHLQDLDQLIRGKGRPDFPFLSSVYSPGSRVPCTDFTHWMAERLEANDLGSVKYLLRQILAFNSGVNIGASWSADLVDVVTATPFALYVTFSSLTAFFELKAIVILLGLDGAGDKGFSLASPKGRLLADIIACNCPRWSNNLLQLRDRANAFIRRMRRDTPFWKEFPLFHDISLPVRQETPIDLQLRRLTPAARLDLFRVVADGPIRVDRLGSGGPFGHDTAQSRAQLEALGFLRTIRDESVVQALWGKEELLDLCRRLGISHRKEWKKALLVDAVRAARPDLVDGRLATHAPVVVPPETANLIAGVRFHSHDITTACTLLLLA